MLSKGALGVGLNDFHRFHSHLHINKGKELETSDLLVCELFHHEFAVLTLGVWIGRSWFRKWLSRPLSPSSKG